MRARLAATVLATNLLAGPVPAGPVVAPIVEIRLEIRNGLPITEVLVSGEPLTLFLDLGGFQAISLTAAEMTRAKVNVLEQTDRHRNSSGTVLESRRFVVSDVSLGGKSFGRLEGSEAMYAEGQGPPERNGYIGFGLLGKYLLVLDYPARRARLYPSGDFAALAQECGTNVFALTVRNNVVSSTARTEYGEFVFEWDTGTTHNFFRPTAFKSTRYPARQVDDGPPVVTFSRLSLAGKNYGPLDFRLVPFTAPDVDGMLGAGLFASRKVCLDVPKRKGAIAPVH